MPRKDVYIMNNFVLEILLISLVSSFTFYLFIYFATLLWDSEYKTK